MRTENKPPGVDGYIRVSRIGGRSGDGYISPDVQRNQIEEYAAFLNLPVIAWHSDEDYSGGNTQRPGFQEIMRRIKAGETGGVIVAHTDRFSRSVADGSAAVQEIIAEGGVFASAMERMDPRTPAGMYMLNNFFNQGEYERETKKAAWAIAKTRAVDRGVHIGRTPFGYDRPGKGERLVPNEHADAVRAAFAGRLVGRSYSDIARQLDRLAPKPQTWQANEIKRILRNRVYIGEISYRGVVHDLANTAAHDPIIDRPMFETVQRTLKTGVRLRAESPFLLSGLIRCAHCRYSMGGFSNAGTARGTPVYRCTGRSRCSHRPIINADKVEGFVLAQWKHVLGEVIATGQRSGGNSLAQIDERLGLVAADLDAHLEDLGLKRRLGQDRWRSHMDLLLDEQATLTTQREIEVARLGLATAAAVDLDALPQNVLRDALRGAMQFIFVRKVDGVRAAPVQDRVRIAWAGGLEIETPRAGKPGPFPPVVWDDLPGPTGILASE